MTIKDFRALNISLYLALFIIGATLFNWATQYISPYKIDYTYWYSLCTQVWAGQLVFSFFSATLFTFIIDKSKSSFYGVSYNSAVISIYRKWDFSLLELLVISLFLGIINLVYVLLGQLNAIAFIFIINAIVMIIALLITIDCIIGPEIFKKAIAEYLVKRMQVNGDFFKFYFSNLSTPYVQCCFEDKNKFKEELSFIEKDILNSLKKIISKEQVEIIIGAIFEISNKLRTYQETDLNMIKELMRLSIRIIKFSNFTDVRISDRYLELLCTRSEYDNDEILSDVMKEFNIVNDTDAEHFHEVLQQFENNIEILMTNNKILSSLTLITVFKNYLISNQDKTLESIPELHFVNKIASQIRSESLRTEGLEINAFYLISDLSSLILKMNWNDGLNGFKNNYRVNYGNAVSKIYLAIEECKNLSDSSKSSYLNQLENHMLDNYVEDETENEGSVYEIALCFSIKTFFENGKEHLRVLLNHLSNHVTLSRPHKYRKHCLIFKISYYCFYILYKKDTFSESQISFIKHCINTPIHKTHHSFSSLLRYLNINVWNLYSKEYLFNSFLVDMEYTADKIPYKGYAPFLANNWFIYYSIYSSFFFEDFYFSSVEPEMSFELLTDNNVVSILGCFDNEGNIKPEYDDYASVFKSMLSIDEEHAVCANSNFFRRIRSQYKKRIVREAENNREKLERDGVLAEKIALLRDVANDNRTGNPGKQPYLISLIESSDVLIGSTSRLGGSLEEDLARLLKNEKPNFENVRIQINKVNIDDNNLCRINYEHGKYMVRIVNRIELDFIENELEAYLNNKFIKFDLHLN